MLDLPPTEHWPAHILAKSFSEEDLARAIAYLELVRSGEYFPGPEMFVLGIDVLEYAIEEVEAVQRKLALAISHQRKAAA